MPFLWKDGRSRAMNRFISVNHRVCTGCQECEVVCSLYHFGECNPQRSAVRVTRTEHDGLADAFPVVCQQCDDAPCIGACPSEAISQEERKGFVRIDRERCTACGACVDACPIDAIFMDDESNTAMKCDLCGGSPQCVALCHSHCLTTAEGGDMGQEDRIDNLRGLIQS